LRYENAPPSLYPPSLYPPGAPCPPEAGRSPWDYGLPDGSPITDSRAWPPLNGERPAAVAARYLAAHQVVGITSRTGGGRP
jgi:hypothetical protein